jgi:hypothetical protein
MDHDFRDSALMGDGVSIRFLAGNPRTRRSGPIVKDCFTSEAPLV